MTQRPLSLQRSDLHASVPVPPRFSCLLSENIALQRCCYVGSKLLMEMFTVFISILVNTQTLSFFLLAPAHSPSQN